MMAVGAGLGALFGKVEKTGINKEFQEQGLAPFGGIVLKSSLSKDAERELQEALHGEAVKV
jgi:uncharacterized membrane protein